MQPETASLSRDTALRIQKHLIALDNPDQTIAYRAERRLLRFGGKAVNSLLEILNHSNPLVRLRAGWVLGFSQEPRAFDPLCALLRDEDSRVRYDIAVALGHFGDKRAIPLLWELVDNEDDPITGSAAASALLKFGIRAFPETETECLIEAE